MTKLYPPYINGTIPAFTTQNLQINFENNATISFADVYGMQILIKDLYNTNIQAVKANNYNLSQGVANFDLSKLSLVSGSYYKIQLAYIDKYDEIGYYSTVGITKFTTRPKVIIDNLAAGADNPLVNEYIGKFVQLEDNDITEKLYSSYFIIYDLNDNIIFQSEEKIHNSTADTIINEQQEILQLKVSLPKADGYKIQFCTISLNGLKTNSIKYNIIEQNSIDMDFAIDLIAENNYEEGYVQLKMETEKPARISGLFAINRINKKTQEKVLISNFRLNFEFANTWTFKDYTIEQGQYYSYTIQQFNNKKLYSKPIESNVIYADYEYVFLTDGVKQLKIKYNPKISSFKSNVLEQKTETIGNQYPFIYRNANVNYKEFNIQGLLSYLSDDANEFLDLNEIDLNVRTCTDFQINYSQDNYKTNLTSLTIEKERQWKLAVLNWLNNGSIKLFKSSTEGNYLVRLFNVSLSPEEKVGRMLHSFSAVAYEIDKISPETLEQYGLLQLNYPEPSMYAWSSWDLEETIFPDSGPLVLNTEKIFGLKIVDMRPGAKVDILFSNQAQYETILIGATGAYTIDNIEISSIRLLEKQYQGIISYKHFANNSHFDKIDSIKYYNTQLFSVFGDFNFNQETLYSPIYFIFNDLKYNVNKINYLSFEKRPIIIIEDIDQLEKNPLYIYYKPNKYMYNINTEDYDNLTNNAKYYIYNSTKQSFDEYSETEFNNMFDNLYKIKYNNNIIDLTDLQKYQIPILKENTTANIEIGLGIKMDIGLSFQEKIYNFENKYFYLKQQKELFLNLPSEYNYNCYMEKLNEVLLKEGVIDEND